MKKSHQTYDFYAWWTRVHHLSEQRRRDESKLLALSAEYATLGNKLAGRIRYILEGMSPDLARADINDAVQIHKRRRGWKVKKFPVIVVTIAYQGRSKPEGIKSRARVEARDFLLEHPVPVTLIFNLKTEGAI